MVPRLKNTKFHTPVIVFGNIINKGHVMPQNSFPKGLRVNSANQIDVLGTFVRSWINKEKN